MGLLSDIKGKRSSDGGVYFEPGSYLVEINRVKTGQTRKKKDYFAVECKILESSCKERPVGSDCTWMLLFEWDSTLGNVADFLRAAFFAKAEQDGEDIDAEDPSEIDVDEDDAEEAIGEDQPLAGVQLRVVATNKKTNSGGDFTIVKFTPPSLEE